MPPDAEAAAAWPPWRPGGWARLTSAHGTDRSRRESTHVLLQEAPHQLRDQVAVFLEREVSGVEQMELERPEVPLVRMRPGGGKDLVLGAPHHQRRRLMLAQVGLPFQIQGRVAAVVVEELQLNR